ncbi:AtzE family amidohydrolase [Dactylococcopsis salina]|uniref:Amidohydrolase, AtzE family n=1 Tax=Dactylococcopsis salina (strain PCC 8305) TaxID=13035 RepID=K9YX04_DACS8|nr:AtzE family amidohydrolase [Dactylococcopsis salina]AFZ50850.1 amidohydrolase, AtzE family [Dactylococcopsis salina PCC 8305]
MDADWKTLDAVAIAQAIRHRKIKATDIITATLTQIEAENPSRNCFTTITKEAAQKQAQAIHRNIEQGSPLGILTGVPFAVKNSFDIAGVTTLAGAKINAENPPATADATAIARLKQGGAILVGALNMDEYAYGFVTENSHYGVTPNPHDASCIAGGSSGASAAAVASGLVPIALGSDTNGSVRVPAALCGVYGLKPTYGRLSRAGTVLLSDSLDQIGIFARSVRDLATVMDLLQGEDITDPVSTKHPPEPCLPQLNLGIRDVRVAVADGYFASGATPEALAVVEELARVLGTSERITLPESDRARAAAYLITASEGASQHLANLKSRPQDFDPATRDRFLAGALIPSQWYHQAQRFRSWYRDRLREVFQNFDIILAPTTPCVAPKIGQKTVNIDGKVMSVRPNLGRFTQPLSFVGLPVLSVPIYPSGSLPLGVQIITSPYNEALLLRLASVLEREGIISITI